MNYFITGVKMDLRLNTLLQNPSQGRKYQMATFWLLKTQMALGPTHAASVSIEIQDEAGQLQVKISKLLLAHSLGKSLSNNSLFDKLKE